ncbi:hypothetical protein SLA2020_146320 [Shorea laevis]
MEQNGKETMEKKDKELTEQNGKEAMEKSDKEEEINYGGWKVMPFIIGNETFERLGAIGTLANLLIYLTTVFNLKSITAATMINIFNGTTNFGTLIGAFLCDTYFGRYKTLGFAICASFVGLLTIQLTAAIPDLHPSHCGAQESSRCEGPTAGQMAFLLTGLGLVAVGGSGIRPCNLAFGADQFNPKIESVYFMGSKTYVKVKATGSPMTSVAQVLIVSIKKRKLNPPDQPSLSLFNYIPPKSINSKLPYTDHFRFIDKAAILTPQDQINPNGSPADPWRLCSLQQVEEVKCLFRVFPIWASAILYYIVMVQQTTYGVFQAVQADRRLGSGHFKIPAATFTVFLMLGMTIFIPIYDRILVPFLRQVTGKEGGITILQRIGIGIFLSVVSMLVSAFVEERRRTIAITKPTLGFVPRKGAISSMSGLWLIPQFTLAGLAEGSATIGLVEFYYKQFPENMRSIAGSLFLCNVASSNYLSSLFIAIVHRTTKQTATGDWLPEDLNKGRLDYFYYMIVGLGVLNMCYFLVCAKWYKYKENSNTLEVNGEEKHSAQTLV